MNSTHLISQLEKYFRHTTHFALHWSMLTHMSYPCPKQLPSLRPILISHSAKNWTGEQQCSAWVLDGLLKLWQAKALSSTLLLLIKRLCWTFPHQEFIWCGLQLCWNLQLRRLTLISPVDSTYMTGQFEMPTDNNGSTSGPGTSIFWATTFELDATLLLVGYLFLG